MSVCYLSAESKTLTTFITPADETAGKTDIGTKPGCPSLLTSQQKAKLVD